MGDLQQWQAAQRQLRRAWAAWREARGSGPDDPVAVASTPLDPPDLLAAPTRGRSGIRGEAAAAARRALRRLLGPFILAPQTRFNRSLAAHLADHAARLTEVEQRLNAGPVDRARTDVLARGLGDIDYLRFEDRFRGESEAIMARQEEYVGYFDGVGEVLDIGCGRGELLALLRDRGVPARGVDVDETMVAGCAQIGLYNVERADAVEYLDRQPDGVFGGVFIGQVVEHLTTPELVALLDRIALKCAAGAVLIVETINPESFPVLARWFWLDPTHTRLVHPETLQYLISRAGFEIRTVQFRQEVDPSIRLPSLRLAAAADDELARYNNALAHVNDALFGPLDYFVVAVRG
jgi:2-polyprenyl-3-methyl-5-hydroxy-6-metoxy-1,4-benzoquinol methylase